MPWQAAIQQGASHYDSDLAANSQWARHTCIGVLVTRAGRCPRAYPGRTVLGQTCWSAGIALMMQQRNDQVT
jgi:hypothetical protein